MGAEPSIGGGRHSTGGGVRSRRSVRPLRPCLRPAHRGRARAQQRTARWPRIGTGASGTLVAPTPSSAGRS